MSDELSSVRVIEMKTNLRKDQFWDRYERSFQVFRSLYNEVPCWGLDRIEQRTERDVVQTDLTLQRRALYEQTDQTLPYDRFCKCLKAMWLGLLNSPQGGHMYTKLFEGAKSTDLMTDADWTNLDTYLDDPQYLGKFNCFRTEESQFMFRISNQLKLTGFLSRYPFTAPLTGKERSAITKDVMSGLKSWIEMMKSTEENYTQEEVAIERMRAEVPERIQTSLFEFFDTCIGLNLIHHFDQRVHHYLRDCIIPALQQKHIPTEHFYLKTNWKGDKQKRIPFSLDLRFTELLAEMPELWDTLVQTEDDKVPKPLLLIHIHLLEAIMSHMAHRPTAAYAFVGETDYHRFHFLLGANYTKHLISGIGSDLPDRMIRDNDKDLLMQNGRQVERLYLTIGDRKGSVGCEVYTVGLNTKGEGEKLSTLKPTPYFQNLQIWTNPESESTYLMFTRKGIVRSAIMKEPVLIYRKGAFYLRLSMTVEGMRAAEDHIALQYFLSAAATGKDTSTDTKETIERFRLVEGRTYRVMGVDLGVRSPYAWAVGESTITGVTNQVRILNSGEMTVSDDSDYTDLYYAFKNLSCLIGQVKQIQKGKGLKADEYEVALIRKAQQFFADYQKAGDRRNLIFHQFSQDPDPLRTMNQLIKRYENNLETVKTDFSFLPNILLKYLNLQFSLLRDKRRNWLAQNLTADQKFDHDFKWLSILEHRKRVCRALSYLGSDNSRTAIVMTQHNAALNGCKDNFLKQIASKIVSLAHQNNCCLICLEDLEGYGKALNQRNENFLTALWSPKRIKAAIINAASWYGIGVTTVSEAQTSQVHYESGRIGYRLGKDLFFPTPDGQIGSVPSDINAAKNIVRRFFSRHTDLHHIYLKRKEDEPSVKKQTKPKEPKKMKKLPVEGGKRMKGCLIYQFGSVEAAKTTLKGTGPNWYLDGVEWIDKAERNLRREQLQQRVETERMPF